VTLGDVYIDCDCERVVETLCKIYNPFINRVEQGHPDIRIRRHGDDYGDYIVGYSFDTYLCASYPELIMLIYIILEDAMANRLRVESVYHGGVVCRKNSALGLIAPTRTGKSTLVAGMCANGYNYMSDDYICVSSCSGKIYAHQFPKPLVVRDLNVFDANMYQYLAVTGKHIITGDPNYILCGFPDKTTLCPLKYVFFIERSRVPCVRIVSLSSGQAYKQLLLNSKRVLDIVPNRTASFKVAKAVKCFWLEYQHWEQALERINDTISRESA